MVVAGAAKLVGVKVVVMGGWEVGWKVVGAMVT